MFSLREGALLGPLPHAFLGKCKCGWEGFTADGHCFVRGEAAPVLASASDYPLTQCPRCRAFVRRDMSKEALLARLLYGVRAAGERLLPTSSVFPCSCRPRLPLDAVGEPNIRTMDFTTMLGKVGWVRMSATVCCPGCSSTAVVSLVEPFLAEDAASVGKETAGGRPSTP